MSGGARLRERERERARAREREREREVGVGSCLTLFRMASSMGLSHGARASAMGLPESGGRGKLVSGM